MQAAHEARERKRGSRDKNQRKEFNQVFRLSFARHFVLGEGVGSLERRLALERVPEAGAEPCFPAIGQIGVPTSKA